MSHEEIEEINAELLSIAQMAMGLADWAQDNGAKNMPSFKTMVGATIRKALRAKRDAN